MIEIGRPIAIDLFAGAGGFSLGVEQAGFDVALAVENDPVHAAVYSFNFSQTPVLRTDVSTLTAEQIQHTVGDRIDLIFGGPPCQGFSIAGKHDLKDSRNRLIFHFCRLVGALQPRYFIMENVPGLRQGNNKMLLRRLKHDFKAVGYKITEPVRVLNAADFGVPQARSRLFLLGTRSGEKAIAYPSPIPEARINVKAAIADLPDINRFKQLRTTDEVVLSRHTIKRIEKAASDYTKQLRGLLFDGGDFAFPRQWNPNLLTNSWQTQHRKETIERFKTLALGQLDPVSRLRRLDWEDCCYTLRAGTGSERGAHTAARPIHPRYHRTISVREAARLHSFPDWFRLHATKWHGFRQVGNAVPPLLARAIAAQIIQALEIEPSVPKHFLQLGDRALLHFTPTQAERYWRNCHNRTPFQP